ncbi:MAG: hypothetical protein LRY55_10820 [Leadbetterella sp.]|nr:hypothetical protein [Leadbetterella sp.]
MFFCLFSGAESTAQLKSYKRGLSSFDNGHYNIAIQEFLKVKDIEPAYEGELNRKLGGRLPLKQPVGGEHTLL